MRAPRTTPQGSGDQGQPRPVARHVLILPRDDLRFARRILIDGTAYLITARSWDERQIELVAEAEADLPDDMRPPQGTLPDLSSPSGGR